MAIPIIQLENLNLYYDKGKPSEVWALKNINIEINKGEYVAFFGPSGCGKTTLLYTISGIDISKVTDGKILINGRDLRQFSQKELAIFRQMGIGIIFQQFNLIPSLSVLDNVALPMAFLGVSLDRRKEEAANLLARLNLTPYAGRYPSELSGGQQQRVGIARALANNPPIIVADEPLGNLDSENANKVLEFLKELNEKDGRTVIMVTHEAWSLRDAKRIFYIKDGEIVKIEEPKGKTETAKSITSHVMEELYPDITSKELIAKSLSHLFLRGYSNDEIKRFEFFLVQRFNDKLDKDTFRAVLDRPYKHGGLGLWKQKAAKIAEMTEELIERRKDIDRIHKELELNLEVPLYEEIRKLSGWLLEEFSGKITDIQKIKLEEIVSERLRKIISSEDFLKVLRLPKNEFGLGLSLRVSQRMSDKLDSILGDSEPALMQ